MTRQRTVREFFPLGRFKLSVLHTGSLSQSPRENVGLGGYHHIGYAAFCQAYSSTAYAR